MYDLIYYCINLIIDLTNNFILLYYIIISCIILYYILLILLIIHVFNLLILLLINFKHPKYSASYEAQLYNLKESLKALIKWEECLGNLFADSDL